VIRRELLPISLANTASPADHMDHLAPGHQWWPGGIDGANLPRQHGKTKTAGVDDGLRSPSKQGTTMSASQPRATNDMSTLVTRGLGPGLAIRFRTLTMPAAHGQQHTVARDIAVYRVVVPSNAPSWRVRLAVMDGDALLVSRDRIPNITAAVGGSAANPQTAGKNVESRPRTFLLPMAQRQPVAGDYYLLVAADGGGDQRV
jgi:hypothetical protein